MWILIAMILIMPFETNPYLHLSGSFLGLIPEFTAIKALGMVGVVWAFAGSSFPGRRLALFSSKQARWFALYVFASLLSGLLSGAMAYPVTRLLAVALLFPIVLAVIRNERQLTLVLRVVGGILILVFPYAMRQVVRFGGRLGVGLYEPNYFALAIILLLPLPFVFARHSPDRGGRVFWRVGIGVLLLSLALAGSRGAFLGLLIVAPLLAAKFMKRGFVGLGALASVFLLILFVVPNPLATRLLASGIDKSVRDSGVEISNRERAAVLQGSLRMIAERPLSGVGLGNFKERMRRYSDLDTEKLAHNTYLQIAAEQGLPTLIAYIGTILSGLLSLRRSERVARSGDLVMLRDLAVALQVGLAGYVVSATFVSAQFEKFFWLVMCITICMERIVGAKAKSRSAATEAAPRTDPSRRGVRPLVAR